MAEKITIVFIINGEDVTVVANLNQPLKAARNHALAESHNTGRPPDEWEIRDASGIVLPADTKVGDFAFQDGVRLFLTLQIGAGGC